MSSMTSARDKGLRLSPRSRSCRELQGLPHTHPNWPGWLRARVTSWKQGHQPQDSSAQSPLQTAPASNSQLRDCLFPWAAECLQAGGRLDHSQLTLPTHTRLRSFCSSLKPTGALRAMGESRCKEANSLQQPTGGVGPPPRGFVTVCCAGGGFDFLFIARHILTDGQAGNLFDGQTTTGGSLILRLIKAVFEKRRFSALYGSPSGSRQSSSAHGEYPQDSI